MAIYIHTFRTTIASDWSVSQIVNRLFVYKWLK